MMLFMCLRYFVCVWLVVGYVFGIVSGFMCSLRKMKLFEWNRWLLQWQSEHPKFGMGLLCLDIHCAVWHSHALSPV